MTSNKLDELYAALASDFMAENAGQYSFERLAEIGKNLYEKYRERIGNAICSSEQVRRAYVAYKENGDKHNLLAAKYPRKINLTKKMA